jgi:hypothetical protein
VGVLFTTAYAYAVIAGVVAWYERAESLSRPSTAV